MMKLKTLVIGDLIRLAKYNLFIASSMVALIWVGLGVFLEADQMRELLPMVFFMEASAMTALLVGAEMYYEKKEHTISSMLISPISESDYVLSKVVAHLINILFILVLISVGLYFVNEITVHYGWLLVSTLIVVIFYVGIGLILSYVSSDFTALLINYMLMMIIFLVPSLLVMMNVFSGFMLDVIQYLPGEVTLRILSTATIEKIDWLQYGIDITYMVGLSVLMYWYVVVPGFKKFATQHLGV